MLCVTWLHHVAEQACSDFLLFDKLISSVKKVFLKSPARLKIFKDEAPKLSLPIESIFTHWRTWLNCDSYKTIKKILMMLCLFMKLKKLWANIDLRLSLNQVFHTSLFLYNISQRKRNNTGYHYK